MGEEGSLGVDGYISNQSALRLSVIGLVHTTDVHTPALYVCMDHRDVPETDEGGAASRCFSLYQLELLRVSLDAHRLPSTSTQI